MRGAGYVSSVIYLYVDQNQREKIYPFRNFCYGIKKEEKKSTRVWKDGGSRS